jgi:hypothetical protein
LPLLLVGLFPLLAFAAILGVDLARKRAWRRKARRSEPSATRSEAVIAIGSATAPRAAAGGRG